MCTEDALDGHQNRLANLSNSWMATSVTALDQLAEAAERRLLCHSADLAPKVLPIITPQNREKIGVDR